MSAVSSQCSVLSSVLMAGFQAQDCSLVLRTKPLLTALVLLGEAKHRLLWFSLLPFMGAVAGRTQEVCTVVLCCPKFLTILKISCCGCFGFFKINV